MRARILGSITAVVVLMGGARSAQAGALDNPTCEPYSPTYYTPECDPESTYIHRRIVDPCGCGADPTGCIPGMGTGHDVELTYMSPANLPVGSRIAPVVHLHGGGVEDSFNDTHGHGVNPYQMLANHLARKGLVVIQPIEAHTNADPWIAGEHVASVLTCTAKLFDSATCGSNCVTDLLDKVAWNDRNKENLIAIGHSAGGVAALYVPQYYGSALKGMILVDPANEAYAANPPSNIATNTPIVHLYPDWYGPLAKNKPNSIINLGTASYVTGQWVPIGIRDYPGCNPNTGCHEAHHCNTLGNNIAYNLTYSDIGHSQHCAYGKSTCYKPGSPYDGWTCDPMWNGVTQTVDPNWCANIAGGTCQPCTKTRSECGGWCGRNEVCRGGPTKPLGATWIADHNSAHWWMNANSGRVTERYVIAYAACLGGTNGSKMQPWVTGRARDYDDSGVGGYSGDYNACTKNGVADVGCAAHTLRSNCEAAGCHWAYAADGKVIRLHNGETVTEYNAGTGTDTRYYSSAYTSVPWGYTGSGAFTERYERLTKTPGSQYYIACQSGPGFSP